MKKNKKTVEEEEALEEEEEEDKKKKNKNKNKKSVEEQEVKGKGKGKGKGRLQGEEENKKKTSKYYTYNLFGFPLALQTALFDWDVETFEKGTDYFKSLNLEYVCGPLIDKKREKLALPQVMRKKILVPTMKVHSTIPKLYGSMFESEQRIIAFCREEFSKIRKEIKGGKGEEKDDDVGDGNAAFEGCKGDEQEDGVGENGKVSEQGVGSDGLVVGDASFEGAGNNVTVVKDVEELNSVGELGELDGAFGDVIAAFQGGKGEEKDDDVGDGNAAFEGCKGDEQEDGVGENGKVSEQGVGSDGLVVGDASFEGGKGDEQKDDVVEIGKGFKEDVGSDCVVVANAAFEGGKGDDQEDVTVSEIGTGCDQGVGSDGVVFGDAAFEGDMVENNHSSVVALDGADLDVEYRDIDKQRGRKQSRWLESPWTDPMPKKKRKPQSNEEEINLVELTSFLKNEDQLSFYTGQILPMRRQDFVDLVNIEKWISYLTNLNIKWAIEMDTLEAMRKIEKFEKAEKERRQQTETDYPEFVPLNYQPSPDILRHVTGHDLMYPQPWCEMDSVFIPCHLPGHLVLCHVLFNEGKVLFFDSLNERDGTSHRLKDVCALLYLLPSLLKHAGYYEEMKMDPHASPFTVQSMGYELIPQQDDGYSCGVFLMKYAELILTGVKTPWKSVFGQKDIKDIRKAIAIDIYTNGQPCNSP
ncbi:hypothetical protein Dsin_021875 [Dipteronia sinensis]|uniref:Ubiquitin-like protease family profile domain-containing protein n=1 Tax=Dipteronia sinensis TaxID=43782 RepID=A0AAE0DZ75_9ROSI|nr:hypothetical protein Dsin_021875 [Dipteronia sinensis]